MIDLTVFFFLECYLGIPLSKIVCVVAEYCFLLQVNIIEKWFASCSAS